MLNLSPKMYEALKRNKLFSRNLNAALISTITTGLDGKTVYKTDININDEVVYLRRPNWDTELHSYTLTEADLPGIKLSTLKVDRSGFNVEIEGTYDFDWDLLTCENCGQIECECCPNCGHTYDYCECCPQCGEELSGLCECPKCQQCGQVQESCYCRNFIPPEEEIV